MGKNVSNDSIVSNDTKRINAMRKYVKNAKTEIPAGGTVRKPAQVIAFFERSLETRASVTATRAAYKAALADRDALAEEHRVMEDALKAWVLHRFGADSAEAHEFGYSARKSPEMSVEAKANAVLLNKATREARGTMGKRERLKIKGTLAPAPEATAHASSGAGAPVSPTPTTEAGAVADRS